MYFSEVLPKAAAAAAMARRALDRLAGEVDQRRLEDARLLVSELIANAVEHVEQQGIIELRIDNDDERLRVEVLDPGEGFAPDGHRPPAEAESGWGLHFVSRIADRWGADRGDRGRVWFELMSR
jgi:anti-sigma regulatory factor (Ser/Thr protein kinase)